MQGKAKRSAWQKQIDEGKTASQAEKEYVDLVNSFKKQHGIKPDAALDAYQKANSVPGQRSSPSTQYIMRLLGLEVRTQQDQCLFCPAFSFCPNLS